MGVRARGPFHLDGAEPRIEEITIRGRNGVLRNWDGSYENREGWIRCFALDEDAIRKIDAINAWLFTSCGYRRLELSEDPEHFLLADVTDGPEIAIRMQKLAPFSVMFDCKPQRFLKAGEQEISLTASGELVNPTMFTALPRIEVHGSGSAVLNVGTVTVRLLDIDEYVVLDSETQNAYKGAENKNATISAPVFPELPAGRTGISWAGGITSLKIIPRWWEL